ncbi:PQQ-dependent sugar dehydrogenase [Cellulomonas triticagri]|uniref:PQQ-dependent sugar dehydrogenase n=1 Tax=Cellulomonas triticagri TaxID=2483352 RepID=UPI001F2D77B5|nr:PQQ-dependent sugar dehydrogenase [Cellulomonas triticagri]
MAVTLAGVLTVTGLALGAAPVVAHDGVDHGAEPGADAALDWGNYEKTTLTKDVGEPLDLAVLPDGRVLHTARNGDVRLTDPATGVTRITNTIPVYANSEDGLQSIGIDPDFAENNWVYLVYAPISGTPAGSAPNTLPAGQDESYWDQWVGVNRLSRFQWTGSGLDLASEQQILDVEVQRGQCCHVGADFDWDADGNLYLSTGDNTPAGTPGANGFAPNNDAPGMNPGFDARRGAGNTNDLRGKILRIHVEEDGTYTIPEGNLFPEGTEDTRPEIFVMGVRNPFKIDVDPETNSLSWGDYGPDATSAVAATAGRGPMGLVEWNVVSLDDPHNSGWPYVHGDNFAYNDWDFATATPGAFFDPENLVNDSRWNTGLTNLPPARPATLYYGDAPGDQPWDELVNFGTGNGQGPMGGPVYHRPDDAGPDAWPAYWEGKAFFGEFSQDYLAAFTVDWDTFEVTHIEDVTPNAAITAEGWPPVDNPMDIEFGPDGSMYVLDYGDGFFRANPDAGLYRIAYAEGNKAPRAAFTATPTSSSTAPLTVEFDASASSDPEGSDLTYEWDVDGDGTFDATGVTAEHTYTEIKAYTARLKVTDPEGKFTLTSRVISVGNQAPEVTIAQPGDGAFFSWGDAIPYRVTTQDAEDGAATECSRVSWTYGLGHDEHAHPEVSGTGCAGAWKTDVNSPEHGPGALLYGAVVVTYRDAGANGLPAATGEATLRLNPKEQQAEHAATRTGVAVYADESASGGSAVRGLGAGDSLRYAPVNFGGITGAVVRASGGGEVQLRWGAADAAPFATATIPAGSGWKDVEITFDAPEGTGELFVTSADELALDAVTMVGAGAGDVTAPTVAHTLAPAAPTGAGGVYTEPVRFSVQPTENGALASVQYSRDGGTTWVNLSANQQYGVTFSESGAYDLRYRATDTAGLVSEVGQVAFTIDLDAPEEPTVGTTTTATVAAARVPYGAPGAVAVVVGAAEGAATGEVVLTVGETEVGRGELGADGTASIALDPTLGVGTHTVTASFLGGEVFQPSSGTVRLTVARTTSTVTATVSPNPVKPAVAAKATVQVTTASGVAAPGDVTVTVKRNNAVVATLTGTLDASGASVVTLGRLPVGTYKVDVAYAGTPGIGGATASTTLTVRS